MPDFEKHFKKQRSFWDAFVQYKLSKTSEKRTAQAKENASKNDTLSSSRVRRLFDGDPQMTENGRRPHSKGNHTDDFRLAAASNEAFCNKSVSSPTMNKYLKDSASF